MRSTVVVGVVVYSLASAQPALAQRFPFERTFDATGASTLDVSTLTWQDSTSRPAMPGRIVVAGTVTVRVDWNVPADAEDLAKQVAANPPIQQDAQRITLRPPSDPAAQRAVTVSYQVRVPPNTRVTTTSDSGATTVRESLAPCPSGRSPARSNWENLAPTPRSRQGLVPSRSMALPVG